MAQKKVILAGTAAVVVGLTGYALAKNKDEIEEMGEATLEMAKDKIDDANDTLSFESTKEPGENATEAMKDKIEEGKKKLGDSIASEQVLKDDNDQKAGWLIGSDLYWAKAKAKKDKKTDVDVSNIAGGNEDENGIENSK